MLDDQYKDLFDSWEEQPPQEAWQAISKAIRPWYQLPWFQAAIMGSVAVVGVVGYMFYQANGNETKKGEANMAEPQAIVSDSKKGNTETTETLQGSSTTASGSHGNEEQVSATTRNAGTASDPQRVSQQNTAAQQNANPSNPGNPIVSDSKPGNDNSAPAQGGWTVYPPKVQLKLSTRELCLGKVVTIKVTDDMANTVLDFGDQHQVNITQSKVTLPYTYTMPGQYTITLKRNNVVVAQEEIQVDDKPIAGFKTQVKENLSVEFLNFCAGTNKFIWLFDDGSTHTSLDNAPVTHYYNSTSRRKFNVKLIALNTATGCADTIEKEVLNPNFRNYFKTTIPNVFTPNNDGLNDVFEVPIADMKEWHMAIMDESGRVVFETDDQHTYWNGKINNTGADCNKGTYRYMIRYMQPDDEEVHQKSGIITLIRDK